MRSLLTKLADWWWLRRTARISTLMDDLDGVELRLRDAEDWIAEQKIRGLVREMFETPDGRANLEQWFGDQQ